jgi:hypothetical protein
MVRLSSILVLLLGAALAGNCQTGSGQPKAGKDAAPPPAEDISGMYSFLNEGEFMQIDLEAGGVSGYISRLGDLESDRGNFLDQFFDKASVEGHEVTFTTRKIHGEWFEFKGRFERGRVKTKSEDGYYVLRGTLSEFTGADDDKNPASKVRQVELKWLAQPEDLDEKKPKPKAK